MQRIGESGFVAISIDLGNLQRQSKAETEATVRLLLALQRHGVPATWAIADPGDCDLSDEILNTNCDHEIAILGDHTWVGRRAGRTRFARELTGRVEKARAAGIPVSTLAVRDARLDQHLDLLVKHRISVVRDAKSDVSQAIGVRPRSLRYGVLQAPATYQLPAANRWWQSTPVGVARKAIQRASVSNEIAHVVFDMERIATGGGSAQRCVEQVLQFVSRRASQTSLVAVSLRRLAEIYSPQRQITQSRSILRAAA